MAAIETTAAVAAKILSPVLSAMARSAGSKIGKTLEKWTNTTNLKRITRTLSKVENVKTLWSPDKEVSLLTFYHPCKISESPIFFGDVDEEGQTGFRRIQNLDDLPSGNLTIVGIVGQGKSIFLRYLASQAIRDAKNPKVPLFIELRTLTQKSSLRQSIYRSLESIDVKADEHTFEYLAKSERLVLLLDAFDELQEELIRETLNEIDYISTKFPEIRIIVTSRPGNEIQKASGFQTVELGPIRRPEFPSFLQKLGLGAVKKAELLRAIDESPSRIDNIIRTPLMLTLVVIVYESEREIPPTLPDFFERLFQVVFTRHDRLKSGFNRKHHSGLSERRLQALFEAFCFMTLQSGYGRTLTREHFNDAFDQSIEYIQGGLCEVENFRLDITKVACLMLEEGIDLATFLHKSIVEYYAAAFIAHSSDDVAQLFYQHVIENYRPWGAVVSFLSDIDPYRFSKEYTMKEATRLLEEVDAIVRERKSANLLRFIEANQPRIGVAIKTIEKTPVEDSFIRAYGPMSEPTSLYHSKIPDYIIRGMNNMLPRTISARELNGILGRVQNASSLTGAKDEKLVTHDALIEIFGPDDLLSSLGQFSDDLRRQIDKARAIIDSQEKRKIIFSRPSKR